MTKLKPGDRVSCEVRWKSGRTTTSEGRLISIVGDKAYVETSLGTVEVDLDSVDIIDGIDGRD